MVVANGAVASRGSTARAHGVLVGSLRSLFGVLPPVEEARGRNGGDDCDDPRGGEAATPPSLPQCARLAPPNEPAERQISRSEVQHGVLMCHWGIGVGRPPCAVRVCSLWLWRITGANGRSDDSQVPSAKRASCKRPCARAAITGFRNGVHESILMPRVISPRARFYLFINLAKIGQEQGPI